jgi:hypothetical protein
MQRMYVVSLSALCHVYGLLPHAQTDRPLGVTIVWVGFTFSADLWYDLGVRRV